MQDNLKDILKIKGCVYMATSPSGKKYVGMTKDFYQRYKSHKYASKNHNNWLYQAIRKHGWDNFNWEILCESSDQRELKEKEKEYVLLYDTFNNGYNMNPGGVGLIDISRELKLKRKKAKGQKPINVFILPDMTYYKTFDFISDCTADIGIPKHCATKCINPNEESKKWHNYYLTYDDIQFVESNSDEIRDYLLIRQWPTSDTYTVWNKGKEADIETKDKMAFKRSGKQYEIQYLFSDKKEIHSGELIIANIVGLTRKTIQTTLRKNKEKEIYVNEFKITRL